MLRVIYVEINTEDGWRRRTNKELAMIYKEPKITSIINLQAFHVVRPYSKNGKEQNVKNGPKQNSY